MKLDVLFHYDVNESTGEITYIGKEEITVDTKKTSSSTKKKTDTNPNPVVTLDSNKLILTQGAVDLLKVCPDCRVDIKYKKKDKKTIPVIGTDQAFGTKGGNKLTQSNTVSYRGSANDKLAAFGTIFELKPTEDEGIFFLIGNKEEIEPEATEVDDEFDIDSLDDLDIEDDDTDLDKIDFKF
jgi:hypothetical protein